MPYDKPRKNHMEDTWKTGEFQKALEDMDADLKNSKVKSNEKDRNRDKENDKERTRDRDKEKTRDRDRDRDRDKEKTHDRDKDKEKTRDRDKDKEKTRDKDRDRDRDKEKTRDRDRDKDRTHDKDRDRDKDKERTRDKDRNRDKDKEKTRDKDRDRDRDKDRTRDKDRDRDNDKEKTRDKDRDRDRDKEKTRDRDRDRDKIKEKTRDKDRDRDKDKEKTRDKDRDRDKDKEKTRDRDRDKEKTRDRDRDKERNREHDKEESVVPNGKSKSKDEYDEYDYDDDFETYDDDFEEDVSEQSDVAPQKYDVKKAKNAEMASILQAMNDENERLRIGSGRQRETISSPERHDRPRPKAFIDFFGAKQRQTTKAIGSKTRQRWNELSRLIDLDKASYDLFELPPVEEYSLYMRQYGQSNSQQIASQTNEDAVERDAQTEDIDKSVRWTQHPPDDTESSGVVTGITLAPSTIESHVSVDKNKKLVLPPAASLLKTLKVFRRLLEEEGRPVVQNERREAAGELTSGYTPLTIPSHLSSYVTHSACFSSNKASTLVTLHTDKNHNSCLLCWNIHQPEAPVSCLESPGFVTAFIMAPQSLTLCGLDDGSLCLWDLKESADIHRKSVIDNQSVCFRAPTYSTAWSFQENHHSSILSLSVVGKSHSLDAAFQLASLDSQATVVIWVASSQPGRPDPAGSHTDLGLYPGSRTTLSKSAVVNVGSNLATPSCMVGGENLFVGTFVGELVNISRFRKRQHSLLSDAECGGAAVTCLELSPHAGSCVLVAGYADGSIRVLSPPKPQVLFTLHTKGNAIQQMSWSRSRPSVFFALDSSGRLLVFDLVKKVTGAVNQLSDGVAAFCLNPDFHSTGQGVRSDRALCLLCKTSGAVEAHQLSETLASPQLDEGYRLSELLDRVGT